MPVIAPGVKVVLLTPDNPRLHHTTATVTEVTSWGAHVAAPAAATGKYRALYSEMQIDWGDGVSAFQAANVPHTNGDDNDSRLNSGSDLKTIREVAREGGYTGDVCDGCGSFKMRRNGACLLCEECGTSSGCS